MNSIEIFIVVEGQTEQTFIREILAPEMSYKGIYLHPVLIGKPGHKGGNIRFDRLKRDIGTFLKQRSDTYISMMVDYFRIAPEWPGHKKLKQQLETGAKLTAAQKAKSLEDETHSKMIEAFSAAYNVQNRFIPYIEMHEFEALLFSNVEVLSKETGIESRRIQEILAQYNNNPEEINDAPETAPSKRLLELKPEYRKVAMGHAIAKAIGIPTIREQCSNFNRWLVNLERVVLR